MERQPDQASQKGDGSKKPEVQIPKPETTQNRPDPAPQGVSQPHVEYGYGYWEF